MIKKENMVEVGVEVAAVRDISSLTKKKRRRLFTGARRVFRR
jgi:hypothetical protein